MKLTKVTATILRSHAACPLRVEQFRRIFPRGAEVTTANVLRAYDASLPVEFVVEIMLSPKQRTDYAAAIKYVETVRATVTERLWQARLDLRNRLAVDGTPEARKRLRRFEEEVAHRAWVIASDAADAWSRTARAEALVRALTGRRRAK